MLKLIPTRPIRSLISRMLTISLMRSSHCWQRSKKMALILTDLIQQSLAEDEPVAPPTVEDQPVEAVGADGTPRNDDPTTETGTTEDDTGFTTSDGGFTVVDESGDAFVMHEDGVQFGAAARWRVRHGRRCAD